MKRWVNIFAIAALSTMTLACGKKGGGSSSETDPPWDGSGETVSVTAILGASYARTGFRAGGVDQVMAVPVYGTDLSPTMFQYAQTASVDDAGAFTLALDSGSDWVLLLLDTTQARKDQVVGYVAMGNEDESLIQIPVSEAAGDEVDMGTLEESGDEAVSSESMEEAAQDFTISADVLSELARVDNVLKQIKNIYTNYDDATGTYLSLSPLFGWYDPTGQTSILNQFANPQTVIEEYNNGYSYYMGSNAPEYTPADMCDPEHTYTLHPPGPVTSVNGGDPWTTDAPFSNEGEYNLGVSGDVCGSGDLYAHGDSTTGTSFNYAGGVFWAIPIVEGWWELRVDNVMKFEFDGSLGTPFEDNDITKPTLFIPMPKVTVGDDGVITQIDVKWYLRAADGTYQEVTDVAALSHVVEELAVSVTDYSGTTENVGERIESVVYIGPDESTVTLSEPFRFLGDPSTSEPVAGELTLQYTLGGSSFRFEWRE